MRKLFILAAIVGLVGTGGYAPEAGASSVSLVATTPTFIQVGETASFNVVMTIDGTGGGDGNVSNTTTLLHVLNLNALITAAFSGPTSSGVQSRPRGICLATWDISLGSLRVRPVAPNPG